MPSTLAEGTAMRVHGIRQWVAFQMLRLETDDFADIGAAYETAHCSDTTTGLAVKSSAIDQGAHGRAAQAVLAGA